MSFSLRTLFLVLLALAIVFAVFRPRRIDWSAPGGFFSSVGPCCGWQVSGADRRYRDSSRLDFLWVSEIGVMGQGPDGTDDRLWLWTENGELHVDLDVQPAMVYVKKDGTALVGPLPITGAEFQQLNKSKPASAGQWIDRLHRFVQRHETKEWDSEVVHCLDQLAAKGGS